MTMYSKVKHDTDHSGQHKKVNRPQQKKMTEKSQEHTCHKETLSIQINDTNHSGQHKQVNRPQQKKMTEKPQEHTCHKEILSIQINNM